MAPGVLEGAGFNTRTSARRTFYRRTKLLYNFDVEDDQLAVLQALLFMSFWYENADERKDAWHWTGVATSLLQILGISESVHTQTARARKLKRLWWSCYIRESHVALAMRLPTRRQQLVPMLIEDDFEPCLGDRAAHFLHSGRVMMYIEMAKLSVCVSQVLSTSDLHHVSRPDGEVYSVDEQLQDWLRNLHPRFRLLHNSMLNTSCDNLEEKAGAARQVLLLLTYHTASSILHLPRALAPGLQSSPRTTQNTGSYESYKAVQIAVREISALAARSIEQGLVAYIPTQGLVPLLWSRIEIEDIIFVC